MIIYKVTNKINNKVYIGKTKSDFNKRMNQHKHDALHSNKFNFYFYNAIRKYGWDNFIWEILTETDSESKLNALEKLYIATYGKMCNIYNCTNGSDGGFIFNENTLKKMSKLQTGRKHTKETIEKIRQANYGNKNGLGRKVSEETRKKLRNRKYSEETCRKISESKKGFKHSEETKKKISETRIKRGVARKEKNPMFGKKRPDLTKRNLENNHNKKSLQEK